MSAGADLEIAVKSLVREINAAAVAASESGLNLLRNAALEVLGHDGNGRSYGRHVASAPGEPPAPDKGNLRRNWQQQKLIGGNVRIILKIKSRMHYAGYLEHGTRKMSARPYHDRIKKAAVPKIAALFTNI